MLYKKTLKPVLKLAIIETHPIQYHAPVYRKLQQDFGIPVTVIYGSDFSVTGYRDTEFAQSIRWDTDLISGYGSVFLSHVNPDRVSNLSQVSTRGLSNALSAANPAAIMLLGYSPRFHQFAFLHALHAHRPLIFRAETTDHARRRGLVARNLHDLLLRAYYNCFAALLYVGKRSLQHYQRLGIRDSRLMLSPYCVDNSNFCQSDLERPVLRKNLRTQWQVNDEQIVLLFSGKLVPRKAPQLLLQAVKLLDEPLRSRICVMVLGEGILREVLAKCAAQEPFVSIRFMGFQNQSMLSQFYCAADLLVLPSITGETWGLVVNEALFHGVPCIVSDQVGCAPDLIEPGRTGDVFNSGRVDDLMRALEKGMHLVGRNDVAAWCRQKVADYSIEHAARGIAQAFHAALLRKK